jgi:hypothetical protein
MSIGVDYDNGEESQLRELLALQELRRHLE